MIGDDQRDTPAHGLPDLMSQEIPEHFMRVQVLSHAMLDRLTASSLSKCQRACWAMAMVGRCRIGCIITVENAHQPPPLTRHERVHWREGFQLVSHPTFEYACSPQPGVQVLPSVPGRPVLFGYLEGVIPPLVEHQVRLQVLEALVNVSYLQPRVWGRICGALL
jgi:hypothetical protein